MVEAPLYHLQLEQLSRRKSALLNTCVGRRTARNTEFKTLAPSCSIITLNRTFRLSLSSFYSYCDDPWGPHCELSLTWLEQRPKVWNLKKLWKCIFLVLAQFQGHTGLYRHHVRVPIHVYVPPNKYGTDGRITIQLGLDIMPSKAIPPLYFLIPPHYNTDTTVTRISEVGVTPR